MSIHVLSWVLKHSEATLGPRLVLLALADNAHDDGSKAFPAVETIAKKARLSERATYEALAKLKKDGRINVTGSTKTGTKVYSIRLDVAAESAKTPAESAGQTADTAIDPAQSAPNPSEEPSTTVTPPSGEERAPASEPFSLTLVTNDQEWRPFVPKVGTKRVTASEDRLARAILDGFNEAFNTHFTDKATTYLKSIVMRIREHPEVTLEQHLALIERQHDQAWWQTRPPTPKLIYGNPGQYENCLYDDGSHTRPQDDRERMMSTFDALADGTFGS